MTLSGYNNLKLYYGDLHNHCHEVGYGYGTVKEAYQHAQTQLDFASVTAHAFWPDIPADDSRLAGVAAYHRAGFRRAAEAWSHFQEVTESVYEPGRFVTFPSFEWHSNRYGDHNVYFKEGGGEIIRAADLEQMRTQLRDLKQRGLDCFLIPHHIGYLKGYRGLNWGSFTPEFSPVVEIISMHGLAESDESPYPYLHTMGPRDERSTMQYGLRTGKIFGVIGSTDHHSAFPGSYGYGRMAVWASELSRNGIWQAIAARRTYALTGDRIELTFSVNSQPMGSILPPTPQRRIEVTVTGGSFLDYVDVLHNNQVIHRWSATERQDISSQGPVKVYLELGWGEKNEPVEWQVALEVKAGQLISVEPRFRGRDILAPRDMAALSSAETPIFSRWEQTAERQIRFTTQTWGNPTVVTPATQGVVLEILGDDSTRLAGQINQREIDIALGDLRRGPQAGYLGGFLTPAYCFHRAVPQEAYTAYISLPHQANGPGQDWYYVRVRQKNGQWAWSSPIWVNPA